MDLLNKKASIGNTFNKGSVEFGHARKVWREQREVLPAGGVITNVSDWVSKGMIPSGRPVVFDDKNKTMEVLTEEKVASLSEAGTLSVNGYLKEDAPLEDENTVATGTVVVDGDLYEYMFDESEAAILKALPQTNGMKIRFVN